MGLQNEFVKTYYDYMVNVSTNLGANRSVAARDLQETLLLEIKLANVYIYIFIFQSIK